MKAQKVTVVVKVECLHVDCVAGLLADAANRIDHGEINGRAEKDDGDTVDWHTTFTSVEF